MHATDERPLAIGSVVQGGYEVLSLLRVGRFGWVYKARQLSTGQDVAIKVLRIDACDGADDIDNQRARFRREMKLCAGMSHPNIVRLLDSGETGDGMLYAVFEYVPGATLRDVLAAEGRLPVDEAVRLMSEVLDALACAHGYGVVHRDLKPDNIMLSKTGARRHALVLDFGLSGFVENVARWALPRLTQSRELMGTPCYAAPEQLRGEPTSTRSDLYSWGLVLLECLTGEVAVTGGSGVDVISKQLGPDPVAIPAWLRRHALGRLVEIVTAKQVEKRDVTIPGLLEALAAIQHGDAPAAAEAARADELPDGERRQLTVVSCRLSVTPVARRALDPEEVDEALHAQHAVYGELAARAGGQLAGVLADRVLLVFGYPRAREDDARRATRTALAVAREAARAARRLEAERGLRLEVRTGVHSGLVVVRGLRQATYQGLYDLVGLTPQLAARLDERAGAGEVLVSGDTHRLLRGDVGAEPAGEIQPWPDAVSVRVFRLVAAPERQAGEGAGWIRETPLVGRTTELRALFEVAADLRQGRARAVLVTGEPGIGKSRLVRELRRRVAPEEWIQARCVAENQASPLRPIVDLLLAGAPIEGLLARYGFDLAETMPLFTALLAEPPDPRYPPLALAPDRVKELTIRSLVELFVRMARERPLVFALEDVHWADPTTLELAALLVEHVRSTQVGADDAAERLGVVFTARAGFTPPWSLDDAQLIQLRGLGRADVEEMIAGGLSTGRALPRELVAKVVEYADGVPLFVEEVTRVLIEGGADDGVSPALDVPVSLRDLLTARLDRLSPGGRETIQLAAVLGRDFRYDALGAIARRDESLLREDLRELLEAGLLFARRSVRSETYVFKHSLVRDTAYDSMTRMRRHSLHVRVASTLRQRFPDVEQHQPELLAQHFERGGETETAAEYWRRAAVRAVAGATYAEAIQQAERGLALLDTLPASPDHARRQIELLMTLGTALLSTQGYGSTEVERTFARARRLCDELGEDIPLRVLDAIAGMHLTRGDREPTEEILPRLRRLTERTDDPVAVLTGHHLLGIHAFWTGDFVGSREHNERGLRLSQAREVQEAAVELGYGLSCRVYAMTSLFQLGYPDQADAVCRDTLAAAERSANPAAAPLALAFASCLSHDRGETDVTLDRTERLIAFATEQRSHVWLAPALCGRAGARLQQGDPDAAIADVRQGLDIYRAIGVSTSYAYYLTYLAAAYHDAGRVDEGLAVVDEALALCESLFARFHLPELYRLRGELLVRRRELEAAEVALRRAVELARAQHGRAFELRASTSLARLLRVRGRGAEGRSVLADVHGWFTEGADTRDVRQAAALLAELAEPARGGPQTTSTSITTIGMPAGSVHTTPR